MEYVAKHKTYKKKICNSSCNLETLDWVISIYGNISIRSVTFIQADKGFKKQDEKG